jgi:hypothetical protein
MARSVSRRGVTHQTTVTRALLGLTAAGALPGVLLTGVAFFAFRVGLMGLKLPVGMPWWAWPVVALVYAVGFALIAALASPVWWALDRRGVRQWWAAALVGAVPWALTFGALSLWGLTHRFAVGIPASMWWRPLVSLTLAAALGAAMGLIAWRIAYRRVPDAAEAF